MIKPLHDFVAIRPDTPDTTSQAGIVLVHTTPQGATMGTAIAVGPGLMFEGQLDEMVINVGDRVLFNRGTGAEVEVDGAKILFIRQRDLMGVIG